jgi:hypothetical protein
LGVKVAKIHFKATQREQLNEFVDFAPKIQDSFGTGLIFCFFFIKKKEKSINECIYKYLIINNL